MVCRACSISGHLIPPESLERRRRDLALGSIDFIEGFQFGVLHAERSDGASTELTLPFRVDTSDSTWIAARASSPKIENEPGILAHTNPVYVLRGGRQVRVDAACRAVLARWERETEYYRTGGLSFA